MGQEAAKGLGAGRLLILRNQRLDPLESEAGKGGRILPGGRDRLAHEHLDLLPKPHVLGTRKADRHDLHAGLDREVGEALVELHEAALVRAVVALWEDGDRATHLQAAIDVVEQGRVAVAAAHDGYITAVLRTRNHWSLRVT